MYPILRTPLFLRGARRLALALGMLLGGIALSLACVGISQALEGPSPLGRTPSAAGTPAPANPLSALAYSIRTRYAGTAASGCAGERTVPAIVGVPRLVDVGGSVLPDVSVTVIALPAVGPGPDVLEILVTRLSPAPLRALVEVVITPDSSVPDRVAAGPDGCESGLPGIFSATVTSNDDKLTVLANTVSPAPNLTIIGTAYEADGAARTNATTVEARVSPVPPCVKARIDIAGSNSYRARVETNRPTDLRLKYSNADGGARTVADARVTTFPGDLDLTFTDEKISYTASAPMNKVDLAVESVTPGEWTSRMDVNLTGVPAAATLLRPSPTRLEFATPTGPGIAPTQIGTAVLTFSQFDPSPDLAVVVPTLSPKPDQYLVTRIEPHFNVATAKVLGLSRADIDSGDPVLVDVRHTAGPFHVVADLVGTETRHLDVDVLNLPATATVTYSPEAQTFTYNGSAAISELTADVTSSVPFVGDADESHLRILDLPTGLTGRLDTNGKTLTATMTGGAIGTLEVGVSTGLNQRLPDGQQGLLLKDHAGTPAAPSSYDAFVRVLGLEKATVTWGDTQKADLVHAAGSLVMQIETDNIDAAGTDLDVKGLIQDLPRTALVSYGPGAPATTPVPVDPDILPVHIGDPDQQEPGQGVEKSSFVYKGSDVVGNVDFDVVSSAPLFGRATEAHLNATSLPRGLVVTLFHTIKHADVTTDNGTPGVPGRLGTLHLEVCSPGACDRRPSRTRTGQHPDAPT